MQPPVWLCRVETRERGEEDTEKREKNTPPLQFRKGGVFIVRGD